VVQVTLVIPAKGTLQITKVRDRYTQVRVYIYSDYTDQILRYINKSDIDVDVVLIIQEQELQGGADG
jgi:hypothetical protein